jgi:hypothetical protein
MTNLMLNQQDADSMRRCIDELLHQMNDDYVQAKTERNEIRAAFSSSDEAFNLLEELELLTSDLRGYASQIQVRGWVEQDSAAIAHLQALRLYSIPAIAQFYFETQPYPLLKEYVRRLDYLRLLLLEYLQVQPESA